MSVALFTHPDCALHDPGPGHPERPERLAAVLDALSGPAFAALDRREAPLAPETLLALAHPDSYLRALIDPDPGPDGARRVLDPDTMLGAGSIAAARRAVGGACAAVDAVLAGEATRAFVAVRPPGHHAEASTAMGFCLFGTVAIAALHARAHRGVGRVAIADFDVHHGNGTQALVERCPEILFVSSHQHPCYPGTGRPEERGVAGNVLNLPLPPGSGGEAFRRAWTRHGLPAIEAFAPELILVSAGFDAHAADPLAQLELAEDDFDWITGALAELAARRCGGRIVSVLEGGYDLGALGRSAATHVARLLGASRPPGPDPA